MDQNYDLKAMLDHYENQRKIYDEELNKSQHEIQRGKHQIFNEHKTKQLLQFENEKLTITNQDLIKQNANLQSQIDKLNKQISQTTQESKQLKQKLAKIKTSLEAAQLQINNLKEQQFCLQKQNQSLNLLLQEKGYLLGNKIDKEKQEIPLSAQHNYPYFVRSIKVVRQENQHEEEYCSDKEVLKDIQEEYRPQEHIMILDFGKSISCSEDRDQTTSIKVQVIEGLGESEQQQQENIITTQKNDVKLRPMKSDRKKKETAYQTKKSQSRQFQTQVDLFTRQIYIQTEDKQNQQRYIQTQIQQVDNIETQTPIKQLDNFNTQTQSQYYLRESYVQTQTNEQEQCQCWNQKEKKQQSNKYYISIQITPQLKSQQAQTNYKQLDQIIIQTDIDKHSQSIIQRKNEVITQTQPIISEIVSVQTQYQIHLSRQIQTQFILPQFCQ